MATSSTTPTPYRPPNWSNGPPMVTITVPTLAVGLLAPAGTAAIADPSVPGGYLLSSANAVPPTPTLTTYVFDAVLEVGHSQKLEKTHHPVQTGADISSHAYLLPPRLTLYVLMSDAVDSYATGAASDAYTQFAGNPSKSVSTYQTLLDIQAGRQPLTIVTRLRTYTNMVITSLDPHEDYKTITGLRMPVEFEAIFTGSTSTPPASARTNTTDSTGLGAVSPTPVDSGDQRLSTLVKQYVYPPQTAVAPYTLPPLVGPPLEELYGLTPTVNVPGAGSFTSIPGQQSLP